jgi:hypothetical protein
MMEDLDAQQPSESRRDGRVKLDAEQRGDGRA